MEKYGQQIGGIKAQMGELRNRTAKLEHRESSFAAQLAITASRIEDLERRVNYLLCLNVVCNAIVIAISCWRLYGG